MLEAHEAAFWEDFRALFNTALENEFYAEVITRTRVKQNLVAEFAPLVMGFEQQLIRCTWTTIAARLRAHRGVPTGIHRSTRSIRAIACKNGHDTKRSDSGDCAIRAGDRPVRAPMSRHLCRSAVIGDDGWA